MKVAAFVLLAAFADSAWAASASCESVAKLKLPHTQLTEVKLVSRGALTTPPGPEGQPRAANPVYAKLPAFCRVKATSRPTADSEIKIEVWLPAQGWNGRLQALGNGGFTGNISLNNLAEAVTAHYAAVATNTGHDSTTTNAEFALGHPEKLIDWGYRAVHEMTVSAKAIIAAYYGSAPKYSYYTGCSTGGRQGLVAAERYPADFDGIAEGDPANPMTHQQASSLWGILAVNHDKDSFITPAQWNMIHQAAMKACDATDGLTDRLISNPVNCKFDPKSIQCKGAASESCLTVSQITAYDKLIAGPKNPRTGAQITPGWPYGPSLEGPNTGREPIASATDTFRAVFQKPDWDYHTLNFDQDIALADKLADPIMNAVNPEKLKALFERGGKLLMYHGWNDRAITPLLSIDYYNRAVALNGGRGRTGNLVRLFMVPGMGHCTGGEGPFDFDKIAPLVSWVETGKAPDRIVASHLNGEHQVDRTRPLCPYPEMAKYQGSGSIDDAANFSCAAP